MSLAILVEETSCTWRPQMNEIVQCNQMERRQEQHMDG